MTRTETVRIGTFLAVAVTIYVTALTLARVVPDLPRPGLMTLAVGLDLTLTVGLAYLLIGRDRWPRWRLVPLLVIGGVVALRTLPESQTRVLGPIELWLAGLELVAIGFLGFRVARQLRRRPKASEDADLLTALRKEAGELIGSPRLGDAAAWELATLRYATAPGAAPPDGPGVFGYVKRSDWDSLSTAILVLLVLELVPVHLLLHSWSPVAAWIVLALSIYSGFWILGERRSRARRPILLTPEGVVLRAGIRWDGLIPWDAIREIEPWSDTDHARSFKATVHDDPELHLELRQPVRIHGAYGISRDVTGLGIRVDDVARFRREASEFPTAGPGA